MDTADKMRRPILQHRRQGPPSGQRHLHQSWRRLQDTGPGLRWMPRTRLRRGERIDGELYGMCYEPDCVHVLWKLHWNVRFGSENMPHDG